VYNINDAKELLRNLVELYSKDRPHMSIRNLTPNKFHHATSEIIIEKLLKNYNRKQTIIVNPL
jgi:hypothetical protein